MTIRQEYPNDERFTDSKITKVEKSEGGGWFVSVASGWSNYVPPESPVEPSVGMTQRLYGQGTSFRGMYLDGQKVFYRTEAEDKEHHEIQMYGADAADWLARWDAGKSVWTIEMGGLGPGYEQCIHIVAAEVVRYLIDNKIDPEIHYAEGAWSALRDKIDEILFANPQIKALGLSGAQVGAAFSIATKIYRDGPRHVMNVPEIKDRHIQVSKNFPSLAA